MVIYHGKQIQNVMIKLQIEKYKILEIQQKNSPTANSGATVYLILGLALCMFERMVIISVMEIFKLTTSRLYSN